MDNRAHRLAERSGRGHAQHDIHYSRGSGGGGSGAAYNRKGHNSGQDGGVGAEHADQSGGSGHSGDSGTRCRVFIPVEHKRGVPGLGHKRMGADLRVLPKRGRDHRRGMECDMRPVPEHGGRGRKRVERGRGVLYGTMGRHTGDIRAGNRVLQHGVRRRG